ncbi:MAG: hypothetical protein HY923_00645 [Elusimicrobia bacterium]|nr:hypothetical protein [Elusimicrobiota bacterium]
MATILNRKSANKTMLAVNHPLQNEVITSAQYTVRVYAPEGVKRVGISIDQGKWMACRPAVGFWWFDWSGYENGEHEIIVSMETPDGKRITGEPHEFFVDLRP